MTGIRQDAYVNAPRIPVEEMKPEKERGFYLHPELFGQPGGEGRRVGTQPGDDEADARDAKAVGGGAKV